MIKPIIAYGNPVLRKVAQPIDASYPQLKELVASMFETMEASDGVGLAAPQIGLAIRLFVIDASSMSEDYPEAQDFKRAFINPRIVEEKGEEWYFNEGCLSVPGIREDVSRKSIVVLEYYDESFTKKTEEFTGICARVIQHEYDHLEGKLFVDRVNPLKKRLLQGRLQNIEKGKVPVQYKIKFYNP
ncbi:MAG TPA: peptide deformylase [Bacteroidales bacterium]|nr:MAG: Peptide deformylase [Bacteroidetes bacterium ADurb.Bin217]HPM12403.1 peptide deformylase [Bacteroidales bacterium]